MNSDDIEKSQGERFLVSVVTVSFNSAKTIERTLQSVRSQAYGLTEHIVIDGGSTDGTQEILRRYERPGFRWVSEPDRGMYDAMNKGIALATGGCVGILNSDDWLELDALVDVASCFVDAECSYTYGDVYLASIEGERRGLMKALYVDRQSVGHLYKMPFPHQTCYVRTDLLKEIGVYSLEYGLSADHDFVVRLIKSGAKGVVLPRPIASYRMGGLGGGVQTFRESKQIAIRYGMSPLRAHLLYSSSLAKITLVRLLPKFVVKCLLKIKRSRHVWY